jgi:hypothetical protein
MTTNKAGTGPHKNKLGLYSKRSREDLEGFKTGDDKI